MEAYNIQESFDEFSAAREQFEVIVKALRSVEMMNAEHAAVEKYLFKDGFELLRLILQGYMDNRSEAEEPLESVRGSGGVERTHRRWGCERPLETVFGTVMVSRIGYGYPGHESIFPLDGALNLPPEKYSHGLQELLSNESAKGAFEEAVATIGKMTGGHIPKRQAEELTPKMSVDFGAFYAKRAVENPEETDDLLVMSTDGKGVVMREEALREATRRSAERARGKKKGSRLKPGEKSNRKRMSTVAAVYTVARNERTPEDILNIEQDSDKKRQSRPKPENKRVWASVEKDPEEVIGDMIAEAKRRDPKRERQWCVLVDGAEHQLAQIKKLVRRHGVTVTIIMDLIHVLEYLWDAAHSFFDVGDEAAEQWVGERALEILRGNAGQVAGGIRRKATKLKLDEKKRANADKCASYLLKHKQYLRYDEYLAEGFPIATGVIEGACRYLVKDRMDLTGARWGLDNAEAVLKLRALRASGDLDEYWDFHRAEEFKRHHQSRYAIYPKLEVVK